MRILNHVIRRKVYHFKWLKWMALLLLLMLLLCLFLKCCNPIIPITSENNSKQQRTHYQVKAPSNWFPETPGRHYPIDTTRLIVSPEDPLGREIVQDVLNVYCQDNVDLRRFAEKIYEQFYMDSIAVSQYAEEYNRIQFRIRSDSRENLRSFLLSDTSDVKFVLDEWVIRSTYNSAPTNDPGFIDDENKWFYQKIGLFDAWNEGFGNDTIIIAVIDDSFDPNHKEFKGRFIKPWNVVKYNTQIESGERFFHGTHVAGTIAGNKDNDFGISGVAPNCLLMPIQIGDQNGNMSFSSIIDGIFYALKNDADIINISLGVDLSNLSKLTRREQQLLTELNTEEAKLWDEIFTLAEKENTVVVQAAGNNSILAGIDPMKRSNQSIVVGAVDQNGNIANFSNVGEDVDILAPGVRIYSSMPYNQMGYLDGTSMAAPIISGCLALLKSKAPDIRVAELISLIYQTGVSVSPEGPRMIQINKLIKSIE